MQALADGTEAWDDDDDFEADDKRRAASLAEARKQAHRPAEHEGAGKLPIQSLLPPPENARIRTSKFIKSATNLEQCPLATMPEFAVVGRSNVGKSSLINMLTRNERLALTSKLPGKTRCINHFLINDSWYLVDLPGYGYAKSSKDKQLQWNTFTQNYFLERDTLAAVMLLVDASVPAQAADLECAGWLSRARVPYFLVFTKADKEAKLRKAAAKGGGKAKSASGVARGIASNVDAFMQLLADEVDAPPNAFITSAAEGSGCIDLLRYLSSLRQHWLSEVNDGATMQIVSAL